MDNTTSVKAEEVGLLEDSTRISSVVMSTGKDARESNVPLSCVLDEKQCSDKLVSNEIKLVASTIESKSVGESSVLDIKSISLKSSSPALHLPLHVAVGDTTPTIVSTERRAKTKGELRKQLQIKMAERDDNRHGSPSPQPAPALAVVAAAYQSPVLAVASKEVIEMVNAELIQFFDL